MVRRDSIFIDGGVQLLRDNRTSWLGFSKYIYEIDMSQSWDANINFTEQRIGRYADTSMNANPPNMVRGALYAAQSENNRLFTFGGSTFLANDSDPDWQAPSQDPTSLWSYDTEVRNWASYNITDAVPWRPNWGAIAEDVINNYGFFLNGQYDRGSSYGLYTSVEYEGGVVTNTSFNQITYLPGLIVVDLHTQETKNVSTASLGAPRVAGGLLHAPGFGKSGNGTLLALGGMTSSGQAVDTFTNGNLVDLSVISLCDSAHDENVTWFNQTATGDVPPPRMDFCVLPWQKQAKDNSSYSFYIHGGYNPQTSTLYDDAYVLSVPSFTWTRIYNGTAGGGRFGHTCNIAGERQMMVTGGARDASLYAVETTGDVPDLNTTTCDDGMGVSIFDLVNATWGTFFNKSAPVYQIPQPVVNVIGGSPDGGATMTEPRNGFAHSAIYTMFHPPPPTATSAPSGGATSDDDDEGTGGGAIAGAVVGSVAGVSLAVLGAWLLLRRKRRRDRQRRRRRHSAGTSTIVSELQGQPAEIHEKPAVLPGEDDGPMAPLTDEPQELEAAEVVELPVTEEEARLKKVMQEREAVEGTLGEKDGREVKKPSPRQSAFVEDTAVESPTDGSGGGYGRRE